ncbi:hypothetical protein [Parashewanella tropica]|uniref:hypothetical protein n=1 Tax=Parashewanella tropica TaxID=2547970 RepID=UPI00105967BB|nr:hypothetical protein [Parashewanella tropica]
MSTTCIAVSEHQHSNVQTSNDESTTSLLKLELRNGFIGYYHVEAHPDFSLDEIACCRAWYSFYANNGSLPLTPQLNAFECKIDFSSSDIEPKNSIFKVEIRCQAYFDTAVIRFLNHDASRVERVLSLDFSTTSVGLLHLKDSYQLLNELPEFPLLPKPRLSLSFDRNYQCHTQFVTLGPEEEQRLDFLGLFKSRHTVSSVMLNSPEYPLNNTWLVEFLKQVCAGLEMFCAKGYELNQLLPSDFGYDTQSKKSCLLAWRKLSPINSQMVRKHLEPIKSKQNAVVVLAQLVFILSGKFSKTVEKHMARTQWTQLELSCTKLQAEVLKYMKKSSSDWKKHTKTNENTSLSADIKVSHEISAIDSMLLMVVYILHQDFLHSPELSLIKGHLQKIREKYWY